MSDYCGLVTVADVSIVRIFLHSPLPAEDTHLHALFPQISNPSDALEYRIVVVSFSS